MKTVTFRKCATYDAQKVRAAIANAVADLGGWEALGIKPGTKVLVKPNLLTDRPPEDAVTTHPVFLAAVLELLKTTGAEIRVGDSPSCATNLENVWETTGTRAVCQAAEIPLVSFENAKTQTGDYVIAAEVLAADIILNLPKVKTHGLTLLTAAVKNLYGVLPGFQKAERHRQHPNTVDFCRYVSAIPSLLPPIISIADGIIGMEGPGPSNGSPVALGFVAAAADPFALDEALCEKLMIPRRRVSYLAQKPREKEIIGDPIAPRKIKLPSVAPLRLLPGWILKPIAKLVWVRPQFAADKCIKCGKCKVACPVGAITLAPAPRLAASKCIGCCCCNEACPVGAIKMHQSPALKLSGALKL